MRLLPEAGDVTEVLRFLAQSAPRAEGGLLCEGVYSPFPRGQAVLTSVQRVDAVGPICSASIAPPPKSDESCGLVKPPVVVIRTASRRNASVYLFATGCLFQSKNCSKETRTKLGQDRGASFASTILTPPTDPI